MVDVNMKELLEAGVHFGHQKRFWNPKMGQYIYGIHKKIHIINLEKTLPLLRDAINFVRQVAGRRGKVLFVGTKFAARDIIREEASRAGMPYVNQRWLGGMLTNYKTIRQSIKLLKEMESMIENPDSFKKMTKKETLNFMRKKEKLAASLDGVKNMGGLPDVLFVIDVEHERIAINEANRLGIPVIGVVDSNSNPKGVNFVIPGNDDALRSIRLYCGLIANTILEERGSSDLAEIEASMKDEPSEEEAVVRKVFKKKAPSTKSSNENPASVKEAKKSSNTDGAKKATAPKKPAEIKPKRSVKKSAVSEDRSVAQALEVKASTDE